MFLTPAAVNTPRLLTLLALTLISSIHIASAYLTFQTIRDLTSITDECTARIRSADSKAARLGYLLSGKESSGQVPLTTAEDHDEVEDAVAAALQYIDLALVEVLNVPVPDHEDPVEKVECNDVVDEYHTLVRSTALFLQALDDVQVAHRFTMESPVYASLAHLQALWASRKPNTQERSFIEQQLRLYQRTWCFGNKADEVLRRDVEIVEYLNDLLDMFP